MSSLSPNAARILDRMEPDRAYDASEIRAFVPETSMETLRETMHELWVERHVERFGYSCWRRSPSTCTAGEVYDSVECLSSDDESARATKAVKPEDLFDHDAFSGFFK
jgi:hypothetical protein